MDASAVLWERWSAQVKELFPKIHGHQKKTLALFVIGIVFTGNAVLQRVAEGISLHGIDPAKMTSIERRLARFLANDRVVVTNVWDDFYRRYWYSGAGSRCGSCWIARHFATMQPSSIWGCSCIHGSCPSHGQ